MAPLPSHMLTLQIALFQGNISTALRLLPLYSTGWLQLRPGTGKKISELPDYKEIH